MLDQRVSIHPTVSMPHVLLAGLNDINPYQSSSARVNPGSLSRSRCRSLVVDLPFVSQYWYHPWYPTVEDKRQAATKVPMSEAHYGNRVWRTIFRNIERLSVRLEDECRLEDWIDPAITEDTGYSRRPTGAFPPITPRFLCFWATTNHNALAMVMDSGHWSSYWSNNGSEIEVTTIHLHNLRTPFPIVHSTVNRIVLPTTLPDGEDHITLLALVILTLYRCNTPSTRESRSRTKIEFIIKPLASDHVTGLDTTIVTIQQTLRQRWATLMAQKLVLECHRLAADNVSVKWLLDSETCQACLRQL